MGNLHLLSELLLLFKQTHPNPKEFSSVMAELPKLFLRVSAGIKTEGSSW